MFQKRFPCLPTKSRFLLPEEPPRLCYIRTFLIIGRKRKASLHIRFSPGNIEDRSSSHHTREAIQLISRRTSDSACKMKYLLTQIAILGIATKFHDVAGIAVPGSNDLASDSTETTSSSSSSAPSATGNVVPSTMLASVFGSAFNRTILHPNITSNGNSPSSTASADDPYKDKDGQTSRCTYSSSASEDPSDACTNCMCLNRNFYEMNQNQDNQNQDLGMTDVR